MEAALGSTGQAGAAPGSVSSTSRPAKNPKAGAKGAGGYPKAAKTTGTSGPFLFHHCARMRISAQQIYIAAHSSSVSSALAFRTPGTLSSSSTALVC